MLQLDAIPLPEDWRRGQQNPNKIALDGLTNITDVGLAMEELSHMQGRPKPSMEGGGNSK